MTILLVENQQNELIHLKKYVKECYPKDIILDFTDSSTALDYILELPIMRILIPVSSESR